MINFRSHQNTLASATVKSLKLTKFIASSTLAFGAMISFGNVPAQALQIFFGEDLNNNSSVPLSSTPNASAAESDFLSNLLGVGTEDFEGFANNTGSPLNLTFPGSTGNITAILSGGNGTVDSASVGSTNGIGQYGISGTNFWQVTAGSSNDFQVNFNAEIGAFGFYGIDIGDFGGQLVVELSNGTTQQLTVPNTQGSFGSTDGSVLFFGLIAENASETFTSIEFLTTTGQGDVFAFDDFTIGDFGQIQPPNPEPTPEPASILGLLALSATGYMLKRK